MTITATNYTTVESDVLVARKEGAPAPHELEHPNCSAQPKGFPGRKYGRRKPDSLPPAFARVIK